MKRFLLAAPFLLSLAGPADATGGLACDTAGASPISLSLVIGHTAVSSVVQARLHEGESEVPVIVAQSWLDPDEVRLDLTDPNAERHELRLRARRSGNHYDGSLWRHGKRRWVRCREG